MEERIDHVAKAIEYADRAYSDDPVILDGIRAQVHATLALVEQQRIANRLKIAELDLVEEVQYEKAGGYALDFRIRPYLTGHDWRSIEVPEDDEVNR